MVVFSTTNTPFICQTSSTITGVTSVVFNYSTLWALGHRSFLSILQPGTGTNNTLSFIFTNTSVRVFLNGNPSNYTITGGTQIVTVSGLTSGVTYNVGVIALH
jgi:hypothetical protein